MVRRRKPSGAGSKGKKSSGPRTAQREDASVKKWNKPEDIPQDEEDLFHAGRDKILLDGSDARYNGQDDDMDDLDGEEVFALRGVGGDSDEDLDDEDDEEEGEEEDLPAPKAKTKKPKGKAAPTPASDDEEAEGSEDDEERWGKNKSAYYSAAGKDDIDSDDEETRAMEEAEVRRLQAKARDLVTDDDFGLADLPDEAVADAEIADPFEEQDESTAVVPELLSRDKQSLLRHLERTSPETLALAREWEDVAYNLARVERAMKEATTLDPEQGSLGMIHLHHQTLLAYATTLAYYLHVRATPVRSSPNAPTTAQTVPNKVLDRLFQLKQNLSILEDLGFSAIDDDSGEEDDSDELEDDSLSQSDEEDNDDDLDKRHRLSRSEMEEILAEMQSGRYRDDALSGEDSEGDEEDEEVELAPPPPKVSKKVKAKSAIKKTKPAFDLEEPVFMPSTSSSRNPRDSTSSAFGDPTALDTTDAADKSARRKTLRFHTSRIEGASRRREGARSGALGGDDDLPWRDARREKQRAADLALKQGRGQGGEDLDPEAGDDLVPSKGKKRSREVEEDDGAGQEEGEDGYYELVKKRKKAAKEDKQAAYDAEREANRPDYSEDPNAGPRSLSRAILKNRGMTPRRAKSVRNPRVKKKERYEKAKKQMSSKKATFKGGMAALPGGRYDGERSGISSVVKSVKL